MPARDAIYTQGWKDAQKRSKETQRKKAMVFRNNYEVSPKLCVECQQPILFEKRQNDYCNHSCAAKNINVKRLNKISRASLEIKCKWCNTKINTTFSKSKNRLEKTYCDQECKTKYIREHTFQKMLKGEIHSRCTLRRTLIYKFGNICDKCSITEWQGVPICLEVDHKDGNPGNDAYENIWKICPNCHSTTKSWKGRNKGNGRKARGLPIS